MRLILSALFLLVSSFAQAQGGRAPVAIDQARVTQVEAVISASAVEKLQTIRYVYTADYRGIQIYGLSNSRLRPGETVQVRLFEVIGASGKKVIVPQPVER